MEYMIKIAVCDDCLQDLREVCRLIESENGGARQYCPDAFSEAEKLLKSLEDGVRYDIYILDMVMAQMNGISLAEAIKQYEETPCIIFLTYSKEYALQAYGVNAIRYLLKPVKEEALREAIHYAEKLRSLNREESDFWVKTSEGMTKVQIKDILYVECAMRRMIIHARDGREISSIFLRQSFEEEAAELLRRQDFMQTHKSYIVNMSYMDSIVTDRVILAKELEIPISKKRQTEVKRRFLQFLADRNR